MDLLTLLFRLPFLPVQGLIKLGEIIQDEAERQVYDPTEVRRQLEEAAEARARGEVSDEDIAHMEEQAVGRLVGSSSRGPASSERDGS